MCIIIPRERFPREGHSDTLCGLGWLLEYNGQNTHEIRPRYYRNGFQFRKLQVILNWYQASLADSWLGLCLEFPNKQDPLCELRDREEPFP